MLIDIPSMLYIVLLSTLLTLISIPPRVVLITFKALLNKRISTKSESYLFVSQFFNVLGSVALLLGLFTTVTLLINLTQQAHQIVPPGANLALSY